MLFDYADIGCAWYHIRHVIDIALLPLRFDAAFTDLFCHYLLMFIFHIVSLLRWWLIFFLCWCWCHDYADDLRFDYADAMPLMPCWYFRHAAWCCWLPFIFDIDYAAFFAFSFFRFLRFDADFLSSFVDWCYDADADYIALLMPFSIFLFDDWYADDCTCFDTPNITPCCCWCRQFLFFRYFDISRCWLPLRCCQREERAMRAMPRWWRRHFADFLRWLVHYLRFRCIHAILFIYGAFHYAFYFILISLFTVPRICYAEMAYEHHTTASISPIHHNDNE